MGAEQEPPMTQPPVTLDELIDSARLERWDAIDGILPQVCDSPGFVGWAAEGLKDANDSVRDLAASVLEATSTQPDSDVTQQLWHVMQEDKNPYAAYRAGFALFRHGARNDSVVAKLKEALADEDVAEIAKSYLDQLETAA